MENEPGFEKIAKENRRANQEADKKREVVFNTKLAPHTPSKKELERRRHLADRKALRRR